MCCMLQVMTRYIRACINIYFVLVNVVYQLCSRLSLSVSLSLCLSLCLSV